MFDAGRRRAARILAATPAWLVDRFAYGLYTVGLAWGAPVLPGVGPHWPGLAPQAADGSAPAARSRAGGADRPAGAGPALSGPPLGHPEKLADRDRIPVAERALYAWLEKTLADDDRPAS
jgi:hypothetical protein